MRCRIFRAPSSCDEARKLCPEVPALIITGYAEADAVSDRPDDVEILLKPFTAKALESAVARICLPPPWPDEPNVRLKSANCSEARRTAQPVPRRGL